MTLRPIARISGLGTGVPATVVTNYDLSRTLDTSNEWIVERTGIRERRIARTESLASLAETAARAALRGAGVEPGELDLIIVATVTPDRRMPGTSCDLQALLGATRAAAFDISAACPGFIYGLTLAEGLVAAGSGRNILVVGAEKLSSITDWSDRSTAILFGDAAGAAVVQPADGDGSGILSTFIRSDGRLAPLLWIPAGGSAEPLSEKVLRERTHLMRMQGREVFKAAVLAMAEATDEALRRACVTAEQIDLFVPHQANIRIIEATAKHAGIPMNKVMVNLDRYGNTSAASIPLALEQALQEGRIGRGSLLLFVAFGAGFTWGSAVVRW